MVLEMNLFTVSQIIIFELSINHGTNLFPGLNFDLIVVVLFITSRFSSRFPAFPSMDDPRNVFNSYEQFYVDLVLV
jgi:hypothetical protein